MKRSPMPRRAKPMKRTRIRPKGDPKKARDRWLLSYGSNERVAWMKARPCLCCGATPSDCHHIEAAGMGMKARYDKTVPLCRGHHDEYHRVGRRTFAEHYRLDLPKAAARMERLWQEHSEAQA